MTDAANRQFDGSSSHISLMHRPYGPRVHMDENAASAQAGSEPDPVVAPPNLEGDGVSVEEAYSAYQKRFEPAESAEDATAGKESPVEGDAAPAEEQATGETQEVDPPEQAPIELPRSWTKEQADHWNALPRETQEYLSERASKDSEAVRRSQNEAAEERKAAKAEREQAEQARKQYEAQLPALMQTLTDAQQSAFADIRTVDDVTKLANEDPFRYLQWQAHQTKLQAVNAEAQRAKDAATKEQQAGWATFVADQNKLAVEHIPELADGKKSQELTAKAGELLRDLGFSDADLNGFSNGEKVSPFDHRIQRLLFAALKFNEAKAAPPKAIPKPVPAVQRPGVPAPRGNTDAIQASRSKLNSTGSVEDAYALYQAKQKARA